MYIQSLLSHIRNSGKSRLRYAIALTISALYFTSLFTHYGIPSSANIFSPFISPIASHNLSPLQKSKGTYEVFGFAPYWNIDKLDDVDFSTLTTLAYFGIPVDGTGAFITDDVGYQTFTSQKATELFQKAHSYGTRVVITLTQMDNVSIESLLDNPSGQQQLIHNTVTLVSNRGIDGVNIDFEYTGDPDPVYKDKFTNFVTTMTAALHARIPASKVTVSVMAGSMLDPRIYDIKNLAQNSDGIFMMAYDFATTSADNAIPTAPLYGYKQGKYWYDVATAVTDFLKVMPPGKLILGVPWYGYNYLVYKPNVDAQTLPSYSWRGSPEAETYADVQATITPAMNGTTAYQTGWDNVGKVGWKAYYDSENGTWRMIFIDDVKSLGLKYDFAKTEGLAGVGMWALGNEDGHTEMWNLLRDKFGTKIADARIQ